MGQRKVQKILFLCTGNYYRSRFAEILFNHIAGRMGLPWQATSRGLALERGVNNKGPMAEAAIQNLKAQGIAAAEACTRLPASVTTLDLEAADRIIALKQEEHGPLLQEHFPEFAEQVEYWQVEDAPAALAQIEADVLELVARLVGGGGRGQDSKTLAEELCPTCKHPVHNCVCQKQGSGKKAPTVRVGRETKGRRGKGVTTVFDVPLDEAGLRELAARLKQKCGTGGTVKDGCIEIQGDQRERIVAELEKLGYKVKRTGG
jgi:protein-tyrosine phosphatase